MRNPAKRCLLSRRLEGCAARIGARLSRCGTYRYAFGSAIALARMIEAVLNIASYTVVVVMAGIAVLIFTHNIFSLPLLRRKILSHSQCPIIMIRFSDVIHRHG